MNNETQSQQQVLNLRFYSDPGHGWLEVDMLHIIGLGLADKISDCSYMHEGYAYLEEECDAVLFFDAAKAAGIEVNYVSYFGTADSKIRSYARYSPPFSTVNTARS